MSENLRGIYAAAVTPFAENGSPAHDQFIMLLQHLAQRGCHGALLAGTTGEGPSLNVKERVELFKAAAETSTGLNLLAGTGATSLEDVVVLTRAVFDHGLSAAVIVPPFFYRNATQDGLYTFYSEVIRRAVPDDGVILLYHNPGVAGIGIELGLIRCLLDSFPAQVVGIKDSGDSWPYTQALCELSSDFQVFVGSDRLLADALMAGGAGAITLVANAFPDLLCDVFNLHQQDAPLANAQARLNEARSQFDGLPRIAAVKAVLHYGGIIQNDAVRPPLCRLSAREWDVLAKRFHLDIEIPRSFNLSGNSGDNDGRV